MREIRRSALMSYPASRLYDIVADVPRYPEFLPWCKEAEILSTEGEVVTARLGLARGLARARFTTENRMNPGRSVEMRLVDGPFSALEGRWDFHPIAQAGCRVEFRVRFATAGRLATLALGPAFERICNELVDAFGRRARELHDGR